MTTIRKLSVALAATLVCALAQAQGAGGSTGTNEPNDTAAKPTKSMKSREEVKAEAKSENSATKKMKGEVGEGSPSVADAKSSAAMKHKQGGKMAKPKPEAPEKDIAKP